MFENITNFFKKWNKKENKVASNSKEAAKERLHLVLMQDRANVSADFLELMKQEIIEVIKKYIDVDENAIDVRLTNKENGDGTNGAPALYANIPILNIKNETRKTDVKHEEIEKEENKEEIKKEKAEKAEKSEEPKEKQSKNEKEPIKQNKKKEEQKQEEKKKQEERKIEEKSTKPEESKKTEEKKAKEKIKSEK